MNAVTGKEGGKGKTRNNYRNCVLNGETKRNAKKERGAGGREKTEVTIARREYTLRTCWGDKGEKGPVH